MGRCWGDNEVKHAESMEGVRNSAGEYVVRVGGDYSEVWRWKKSKLEGKKTEGGHSGSQKWDGKDGPIRVSEMKNG